MNTKADFSTKLRIENASWGGVHDAVISNVERTSPSGYTYTNTEISIELPAGLKPKDFIGTVIHADISIKTQVASYEERDLYAVCIMASRPFGRSTSAEIPAGAIEVAYSTFLQGYYDPENGLLILIPVG